MISTETSKISKDWDRIAINFDRYVTPTANWALSKTALNLAGLKPDMYFLDVASGSGALSLPAARLGAKVLAVDISPVMIERLKARADEERLAHLKGRVMDGHYLDLNDNTFDFTGSQFGVTLFPGFRQGLLEMVRVTRSGGTVFLVSFGPMQKAEFINVFIQAVQEVVPGYTGWSSDTLPLPFQVSDDGVLQQNLEEAGLRNVKVKPVVQKLSFHSGREMWNWVSSSDPIATQMISGLDDGQRDWIAKTLEVMIRKRSGGQGPAILEVAINIGIGEKEK